MEKILEIKAITEGDGWSGKEGYAVITTEQEIKMMIDNVQDCCENWGYFMSENNFDKFIGAKLYGVSLTDTCLNTEELPKMYEGDVMFVNLETSKGVLQFVAYNEHNGYYGHEAVIKSKQLDYDTVL